jgi:hypothetical protein
LEPFCSTTPAIRDCQDSDDRGRALGVVARMGSKTGVFGGAKSLV